MDSGRALRPPLEMSSTVIFGLRVESNRPIPWVRASTLTTPIDLHVSLGEIPDFLGAMWDDAEHLYSSANCNDGGQPTLVVCKLDRGAWFHLRCADGTEFLIDRLGKHLWATWPEPLTVEDTATYLLGPMIGFVLLLRGTPALHASAINVGGQAIALVGPGGAGKSTTAAGFARMGYSVLSDDAVTLAGEPGELMVHPGYPCIRLWPESADALFGARDALPLLTPNWDKRYLDLAGDNHRFQTDSLPLAAIYFLGARSEDVGAPRIEVVAPRAGMIELIANMYVPYLKDNAAHAREFNALRHVIAKVPLRRAIPGADLGRVSDLCKVILDDFRALPQPRAATDPSEHIECV